MSSKTAKSTVTFLRDKKHVASLDKIAEALDRPRSYVINEALDEYTEFYNRQLAKIDRGLADAKAGRFVSAKQWEETLKGDYL